METLPIIIAVAGVFAAIIAYFVGSHASDSKVLALQEKLDAGGSKPSKTSQKKASSNAKPQASAKAKDNKKLMELKETVKKTKSQLHNAKLEIKTLKENAKSNKKSTQNKGAKQDADLIFKLREEVGELKASLETAKASAKKKKEQKTSVLAEPRVETEGMDDSSKAVINELETAHRAKLKSLNEKHRKAEKEIRQKLRSASGNVDKQRRRADNNDRAYKITQRQVDALQERIAFLEKGPNDKPVELQIASAVSAEAAVRVTSKLPASDPKPAPAPTPAEAISEGDAVPGGLTAPSEPTTIEMSPDIAESLFKSGDDAQLTVKELVASPSSVEEEPSRQTMRLDEVRLTDELDAAPKNTKLSEASAVDDAWAEFDVD